MYGGVGESEEASFSEKQKSKFYNKSAAFWWGRVLNEFMRTDTYADIESFPFPSLYFAKL